MTEIHRPMRAARRAERAGVVLTNPDMLHSGILPHHASWARTMQHLRYVVVDELHCVQGGSRISRRQRAAAPDARCAFPWVEPAAHRRDGNDREPVGAWGAALQRREGRDQTKNDRFDGGSPLRWSGFPYKLLPILNSFCYFCANAFCSSVQPVIQFGTETEIGIARDEEENLDVVAESIALVRSATKSGVLMRWDYECEDPHADMRGFHVEELRQDTDEAHYFAQDSARELSFVEIKSDLVLGNGARYYNDHAHPEYCTPECSTVEELVAHDRAGERILMRCARKLSEERGSRGPPLQEQHRFPRAQLRLP